MASPPIVGAEASTTCTTCSLGPGLGAAIFFPFFSRCERALRGVPNARRTHDSFFYNAPTFISSIAGVKSGAESALERFEELQKELKKESFCWKSSILTRSLNRVGFEF